MNARTTRKVKKPSVRLSNLTLLNLHSSQRPAIMTSSSKESRSEAGVMTAMRPQEGGARAGTRASAGGPGNLQERPTCAGSGHQPSPRCTVAVLPIAGR